MFLAGGVGAAFYDRVALRPGRVNVSQRQGPGRHNEISGSGRLARIKNTGQFIDLEHDLCGGCPGLQRRLGDHHGDRLADEVHRALSQQGLVQDDAADLVFARDIGGGEDAPDPLLPGGWGGVEPKDASMRDWRGEHCCVEQPGRIREISHEVSLSADVQTDFMVAHVVSSPGIPTSSPKRTLKWARTSWPSSSFL